MSDEMKTKLIPDKDGFLFEVEDYNYLLNRVCGWVAVVVGSLFILL